MDILILDDFLLSATVLKKMILKLRPNLLIDCCQSLNEFDMKMKKFHPKIVFMDVFLDNENSLDYLKDYRLMMQAEIVLYSGCPERYLKPYLKTLMIIHVLRKPIDMNSVKNMIVKLNM